MVEPVRTLIEVREELMVSSNANSDGNPILRNAHFLKPTVSFIDYAFPKLYSNSNFPLEVRYEGWKTPQQKWKLWVDRMRSKHQVTWKKSGIYDAILSSTYIIRKCDDLIFGVAEKWCPETNTFIFPWGEVTITLEDLMVLMGFSVLGDPVFSPLKTTELKEVEAKLVEVRREILRPHRKASQSSWLKKFVESEDEIEHEAFLALWLSRFVFSNTHETIRQCVFPIAIHLARGTTIALAPAVLADIYKNLSKFKRKIVSLSEFGCGDGRDKNIPTLILWSPFQLVQIWLWERLSVFRPQPNCRMGDELRAARWHNIKKIVGDKNVRLLLDMAGESFQWRLCANVVNKSKFSKLYGDLDTWVSVDEHEHSDNEIESFARCLMASELVGLDCIEQYLPHRVARQFGIDQDLPGSVVRFNETPRIAWNDYTKPMINMKLYIPSQSFKADVTTRYFEWWKRSIVDNFPSKCSRMEEADLLESNRNCQRGFNAPCGGDQNPSIPIADNNNGIKDVQGPMNPNEIVILSDATSEQSKTSQRSSKDGSVNQEEDDLTIAESLRFSISNRPDNHDGTHSSGQTLNVTSSIPDINPVNIMDSQIKPMEKGMHNETVMGGSQCLMRKSKAADVENPVRNTMSMKGNEGEGSSNTNEERIRKLVARITRLERLVAQEKAQRSHLGEQSSGI